MSLRKEILSKLQSSKEEMSLQELYNSFPDQPRTTIRGRVYESVGKGITKLGRGLYISSEAIIEEGNSLEIIDRMIQEGDKFEFIFLDIPYEAGGNKGGNRNLFDKDKISAEEFGTFLSKVELLLKDESSTIAFMFTSGRSSKRQHDKYISQFKRTNLIMCDRIAQYTKLWKNGNKMNMGKYLMPKENIYFFSKTGNVDFKTVQYYLTPNLREYPSSKPYPMIKRLVQELTKAGDWVFDPFGGSGKILQACLELKRKCHIIDNCSDSINNHILKISNN